MGFPCSSGGKKTNKQKTCLLCRRPKFDSWVGKIPWRRKWQPAPVFLPREFHGQSSLTGCSPWGHKRVRQNLVTKPPIISDLNIFSCTYWPFIFIHLLWRNFYLGLLRIFLIEYYFILFFTIEMYVLFVCFGN